MIWSSLTGPGDEAIGAHEHSAQPQPILGVTCDVGDPVTPAACKRLKLLAGVEIQKQACAVSEVLAESRPVDQLEVGSAAAHQRVGPARIIAERNTPHALGEVCRAVARVDEITDDGFERARTPAWPHERDLSARPVKNLRSHRMPFAR